MLVEGFKVRVKAETEVKETVGKGAAKSLCCAGSALLNAHLMGLHSFFSCEVLQEGH